jgi:long-subunit acyl-CoA synthetase (AMP-forming)
MLGEDQSNQEVEACKITGTEDLATIIYTSGNWKPKGVMLRIKTLF